MGNSPTPPGWSEPHQRLDRAGFVQPQPDPQWAVPPERQYVGGAVQGAPDRGRMPPPVPSAFAPVDASTGTPFHRMARTVRHRWWVPPLALLSAVVLFLIVQLLLSGVALALALATGTAAPMSSTAFFTDPLADLAFQLITLALMIPCVFLAVRVVQRRSAGTLSSVEGRLRWRWLLKCCAVAFVAVPLSLAVPVSLLQITHPELPLLVDWVGARRFIPAMVVLVLLVPFQAAAEEYGLRGMLLQSVGAYARWAWVPIVVSAAAFASLHNYSAWAMADVALFGLVMGWLAWRTGGLEAAIGLHVLHNLGAFALLAAEGRLAQQGGSGSWQAFAGTAVELALFSAAVLYLAKRAKIRRVSPGREDEPGAAASQETQAPPDAGKSAPRPPDQTQPGAWHMPYGRPQPHGGHPPQN